MEKIVVSRKWSNPEINVFMEVSEIGASISLSDFLDSIVEEIGNPSTLMTKQALKAKLISASAVVVKELKDKTVHL